MKCLQCGENSNSNAVLIYREWRILIKIRFLWRENRKSLQIIFHWHSHRVDFIAFTDCVIYWLYYCDTSKRKYCECLLKQINQSNLMDGEFISSLKKLAQPAIHQLLFPQQQIKLQVVVGAIRNFSFTLIDRSAVNHFAVNFHRLQFISVRQMFVAFFRIHMCVWVHCLAKSNVH